MTKAKISQYDASADGNTDVNGVNIAEGCAPSGINNAIREVMAAVKRFETGSDGDSVTVGGNFVVVGSTTANTIGATVVNASGNATVGGTLVVTGATTFSGNVVISGSTTANTFSTDLITEKTSAAGVTIDGVLLKDSGVVTGAGTVSAPVYSTTGDLNTGIYFPAADNIGFATNGVIRGRWTTDGLCFNADTAAANALDDYEEGTWTPTVSFVTPGNLTVAYAAQTGLYTKIGRTVFITFNVTFTPTFTTSSGSLIFTTAPFTSTGAAFVGSVHFSNLTFTAGYTMLNPRLGAVAATTFDFVQSGSGVAPAAIANTNMVSGTQYIMRGSLFYES